IKSYLEELTNDSSTEYSLWKATKRIKRPILHSPPMKLEDGSWARNNQQKAERFATHLENTFKLQDDQDDDQDWPEPKQTDENIKTTSPKEVAELIEEQIDPNKAPGYDLITGRLLKNLPRKVIVKLTNLINAAFTLQYIPDLWKMAEVIVIPKSGKPPNEVTSYRPISLLPVMSKVF
ncbi:unnamed protein product, partial [Diabrotica balteata]